MKRKNNAIKKQLVPKKRRIFAWISFSCTIALMLVLCYTSLQPGSESAALSGQVGNKIDYLLTEQSRDEIKHVEPNSLEILNGRSAISSLEMPCGESRQLSFKLYPTETSVEYFSLEWESDDPSVVSVNGGKVTAVSVGTANVTAYVADKKSVCASVEITVEEIVAKSVTLTFPDGSKNAQLEEGRHIILSAEVLPADATNKAVTFSSDDPEVATVDARGVVTAHSVGKTRLYAEHTENGETKRARVRLDVVTASTPYVGLTAIGFDDMDTLYTGESGILPVNFAPSAATDTALIYTSSDNTVLRVNSATGEYAALKRGDVTVTAVSAFDGAISATAEVHVKNSSLEAALTFTGAKNGSDSGYSLNLKAGDTNVKLGVDTEVAPIYVRYETSDKDIAEIYEDGTIATYRSSEDSVVMLRVFVADNPDFSADNGNCCVMLEVELSVAKQSFSEGIAGWATKIRKSIGHFGAFMVLGIFAAITAILFDNGSAKRRVLFAMLLLFGGVLFAGFTEFLQSDLFTVGRAPSLGDVFIDSSGFVPAAIIIYGIFLIVCAIVSLVRKRRAGN